MAFGTGEPGAKVIQSQFKGQINLMNSAQIKIEFLKTFYETSCSAAAFLYFPFLHDCVCTCVFICLIFVSFVTHGNHTNSARFVLMHQTKYSEDFYRNGNFFIERNRA